MFSVPQFLRIYRSERNAFADGFEDLEGGILDGGVFGIQDEICVIGWLERTILAGEMCDFATGGFGVESFDVALFTDFVAGLDVNFKNIAAEDAACEVTEFAAWGDGGNEGDGPLRNQNLSDLRDAADVFKSVFIGETEVGIEAGAEVVAIEDGGEAPLLMENALDGIGDGGFPRAGKPAKPDDDAALAEEVFLILAMKKAVEFGMDVHGVDAEMLKC